VDSHWIFTPPSTEAKSCTGTQSFLSRKSHPRGTRIVIHKKTRGAKGFYLFKIIDL
jgi:hypothetical protein